MLRPLAGRGDEDGDNIGTARVDPSPQPSPARGEGAHLRHLSIDVQNVCVEKALARSSSDVAIPTLHSLRSLPLAGVREGGSGIGTVSATKEDLAAYTNGIRA